MTAGVAVLSLYVWLCRLRDAARRPDGGPGALPARLVVVTDRGKGCREQGNLVVKEAVAAIMAGWGAPFRCGLDSNDTAGRLGPPLVIDSPYSRPHGQRQAGRKQDMQRPGIDTCLCAACVRPPCVFRAPVTHVPQPTKWPGHPAHTGAVPASRELHTRRAPVLAV